MNPELPSRTRQLLHIFIVSGEHPQKCYRALDRIVPDLDESGHITVLSGVDEPDLGPLRDYGAHVTFRHYPGESVWHLRARLPPLAGSFQWILVLEDHNVPLPHWLPVLRQVLRRTIGDVSAVFGATSNLTSTDKWSWANYLAVQVFHWAPQMRLPVMPLPFNAAIRRSLLPATPWHLGEYETNVIACLMSKAMGDASFPVDHIQYRTFPTVLAYHWFNGRSTGAFIRTRTASRFRKLLGHLIHVLVTRPAQTKAALERHPLSAMLPFGTGARIYVLSLMHAAGTVFGFLAGHGNSLWRLE